MCVQLSITNHQIIIRDSFEECSNLTKDLDMRREFDKFMSNLLSANQKEDRLSAPLDFLERTENEENFLKMIVTGDESWAYGYNSRGWSIQRDQAQSSSHFSLPYQMRQQYSTYLFQSSSIQKWRKLQPYILCLF
ncbi:hypothetical protein AVEN_238982-1 [Araneus ventricosus]|uniref:Uncharacterized protein n=1 Tax=Araneus ventricosus TaxID=182803 RepID=A0A4Y2V2S1_ARAVE|nr:hypothetical protein AVEN_183629-1 [Araneus ventricosus]GBO18376.1 hypothetical protein AVEN_238982-1 [Araneus ventricosus]